MVQGCNGIGKHIAHWLVHDGETVLDVPPKLSARVWVFATGNGRKTDPVDAHSAAWGPFTPQPIMSCGGSSSTTTWSCWA